MRLYRPLPPVPAEELQRRKSLLGLYGLPIRSSPETRNIPGATTGNRLYQFHPTGDMAQRMLDEKTRVTEEPPPPSEETDAPFHTDGLYVAREAIESDGETLGSQDTEEDLSTISEEEEEEEAYEEAEKENIPPSRGASRKRRAASSLEKTLTRPPLRKKSRNNADEGNAQGPRKRRPRGNYRSWVRHRVAICQALRDAVFDRKMAAEILKRAHGLFVPPTVLGYYARKLLDLTDEDL